MEEPNKVLQGLGIPYSALVSIIFGLMLLSLAIGPYLVFNLDIGEEINFEFPLENLDFFIGGIGFEIPFQFELGDVFITVWSIYVILFGISILGPKKDFLRTIIPVYDSGKKSE